MSMTKTVRVGTRLPQSIFYYYLAKYDQNSRDWYLGTPEQYLLWYPVGTYLSMTKTVRAGTRLPQSIYLPNLEVPKHPAVVGAWVPRSSIYSGTRWLPI